MPIDWLNYVLAEFATTCDRHSPVTRDIYLDLSYMDEWFDHTDEEGTVDPRYREAFGSLLRDYPGFADQVLYRSDWHMPPIASMGDRYRSEIEEAIPEERRADIMGRNAIRFLGLGEGSNNLLRLRQFTSRNGIELHEMPWYRRDEAKAIA